MPLSYTKLHLRWDSNLALAVLSGTQMIISAIKLNLMRVRTAIFLIACLSALATDCGAVPKQENGSFKPSSQSPDSRKGDKVFHELNCTSCHSIRGKGGCLGPPLDGVGKHRSQSFLQARLTNTAAARAEFDKLYRLPELMPHPRLTQEKARTVIAYLLTLPELPGGFPVVSHVPAKGLYKAVKETSITKEESERIGRQLYSDLGCSACHSIGEIGGHIGPALDGVGKRRSAEFIVEHMTGAQIKSDLGRSKMPRVNASPMELKMIADYLMSLP